ncbi:MAG: FecR domain-containing protein [Pseudomonadota bacterium]
MNKTISNPGRKFHCWLSPQALIALTFCVFLSTTGIAADDVGAVKFARGDVSIKSTAGKTRTAAKNEKIKQNELVITGATSLAVIQLNDDSRITLRPNSEFRVNVLETGKGGSGAGNAVLNLLRGGLRLATGLIGKVNPLGYRLSTPVATIGIRGTEFNTRLCAADCAAEEKQLSGADAAGKVKEGLYVKVDDGRVLMQNFAAGEPLLLGKGESGYVSDLTSLPIKLSLLPAFMSLDKVPSPSSFDIDDIQVSDEDFAEVESQAQAAVAVAAAAAATSGGDDDGVDVSGTYEADISYTSTMALSDRKWFFGANPDIEFTLKQDGNKITGEFEGDRDGKIIKGKIDGDTIEFEFYFEALGGEFKEGSGVWKVLGNGDLKGDFKIRDQTRGVVRGFWTLEPD